MTLKSLQADNDIDETWRLSMIRQDQELQAILDLHTLLNQLGVLSVEDGLNEILRLQSFEHRFKVLFNK